MMVLFSTGSLLTIANASLATKGYYYCVLFKFNSAIRSQKGFIDVELPVGAPDILRDMTKIDNELIMKEDEQAINLTCSTALSGPQNVIAVLTNLYSAVNCYTFVYSDYLGD